MGAAIGLATLGGVGGYAVAQAAHLGGSAVLRDSDDATFDDDDAGRPGDGAGRGFPPGAPRDGTDDDSDSE